jgi:hypothetical protein
MVFRGPMVSFYPLLFSYIFTILYFMLLIVSVYIDHNFTFYREYNSSYVYTATT